MTAFARSAAKVFVALQIPFVFACADGGPGGPGDNSSDARFAGVLTTAEGAAGEAFRGGTALGNVRIDLVADEGGSAATLYTGAGGAFSTSVPSGAYTVQIAMAGGSPLEFSLSLPPGSTLFAEARVDQTPAGLFSLNVQVFHDTNADTEPDDSFRLQILDRVQGDETSGVEDVVTSEEEAEEVVTLCHAPPGNPDNAHTVDVGAPAVPAHLAHGDTEGACAEDPADEEDPEEDPEDEGSEDDSETKVLVCHVPSGNPENAHTIEVAESAVPAHLAHGDTEGACEGDAVPGDDGSDGESEDDEDDEAKVVMCHVPSGNPENVHTIEVGESAVPAHLAHGDTEGACPEETPTDEGGGEGGDVGGDEGGEVDG